MDSTDKNNGLITKIWGPAMWESIHCVAFGYPTNPSVEQKRYYKTYFMNLGHVLPCSLCQTSYNYFIADKKSNTFLSDDVFKNRDTLTKWVYNLHIRVNQKLDVDYVITYKDFVNKYESYRAKCNPKYDGCKMTDMDKKQSYKNAQQKNHVIIPQNIIEKFTNYALERGVTFDFDKYKSMSTDEWNYRNVYCQKILSHMRTTGVSTFEQNGKYKGLPTLHELHLFSRLSSSTNKSTLEETIKKYKL